MENPVGRKLDFHVQELNREFNTIGSKASDAQIAQCVVEAKGEIESCASRCRISSDRPEVPVEIKLINVGYGNFISSSRIIAIIGPEPHRSSASSGSAGGAAFD